MPVRRTFAVFLRCFAGAGFDREVWSPAVANGHRASRPRPLRFRTMTEHGPITSKPSATARRLAGTALLVAAVALAGCGTVLNSGGGANGVSQTSETEDNQFAASPANISSLSAVIQRNPSDPQAYNMRGSGFGQAGRNDEALADFNKAISLDPNYAQAYGNRGLIYRKTGRLDAALADYAKALTLDQNYALAYLGRGIVYRLRK